MIQKPSIHPDTIQSINENWLQAIQANENVLTVFPRGVAGYRRLESLVSAASKTYTFYLVRTDSTQGQTPLILKNLFEIQQNIHSLQELIRLINQKYPKNKQHVFLVSFIDSWLRPTSNTLLWLSAIVDACQQIQFVFLTEENIHLTEKILVIGKHHQLFQHITYIPMYDAKTLEYFIQDYSRILGKQINANQAQAILKISGRHILLVKEAVRLLSLYNVKPGEITQQLSYKIKLSQLWNSFSTTEQIVIKTVLSEKPLSPELNSTYTHLENLGWFDHTLEKPNVTVRGFRQFLDQERTKIISLQLGKLYCENQVIDNQFTQKEHQLLNLFLSNNQDIYGKETIFETLWNSTDEYSDWAIDKSIHRLRIKLKQLQITSTIKTHRGRGYSWQK